MAHFIWLMLVVLWATLGCGKADAPAEPVDTSTGTVTVISTPSSGGYIIPFGKPDVQTFGQVITVPATDTALQSFSLVVELPTTLLLRGEVYAWDGTKATGPNLYESAPRAPSGALETITFETGGIKLVAGAQYVLFATTIKDPGSGTGRWVYHGNNPYAGGGFVYQISAGSTDPARWTTTNWSAPPGGEAAFTATFDAPVPVQSTSTVVSSVNPSTFGQPTTFTATVSGNAGIPTGTITFKSGATTLGTATLNGAGQASLTTSSLPVGSHAITAEYAGDTAYLASVSEPLKQVVNQASTTTTLASSVNPSTVGSGVTFTATVSTATPGAGIAAGTVTFRNGTTTLGTGTLDATGVATFSTNALSVGSHAIEATYAGNASFAGSTSSALKQIVNQAGTTVALASSSNPSLFGQMVEFTASVSTAPGSGTPTGTITFRDGSTTLGVITLNNEGTAGLITSALNGGTHTIHADYSGDTNHQAGTSSLTQTVNIAASTTVLASTTNPSAFGQSITLTATVSGSGGTPTGTVTFSNGSTALGTATLNGAGQASISTDALSVGTHSISVAYSGDTNFAASTSTALSQVVNQAATATTLSSSSNPVSFGAQVTFTATVLPVAPGAGEPTGTVTFKNGTTALGSAPINAAGVATFSTTTLTVGAHTITAQYSGDANFLGSTAPELSQNVSQAGATVMLSSSLNPATFGTSVTFTATVSAVGGGGTPTGSVSIKNGETTLGTATLDNTGTAAFVTAALPGGTHSIVAEYGGDANYEAGSTATVAQTVNRAETTTALTASPNPAVFGEEVVLTATVSSTASGAITGNVTFMAGDTTLGSATLESGAATLTTSTLSVATHALSATYSGDTNYDTSTSTAISEVVNKASTTTALSSSANPALIGANVTLTATVSATAPGAGSPSGTVTFLVGSTTLGSAPVSDEGLATFSTSTLAVGTHTVTAEYSGDGDFEASTSAPLDQVVSASAAVISLSGTPSSSTFGQTVTFTVTVSGTSGTPTGSVEFIRDTATLATETLSEGAATFITDSLPAGTHTIEVRYSGDSTYAAGTASTSQIVERAATTTTLVSSVNPSEPGEAVTFSATVSSEAAGFTGEIEFLSGSVSLGSVPLSGASASLSLSNLTLGNHAIVATYKGDDNFESSSSAPLTQTVSEASGPGTGVGGAAGMGGTGGASAGSGGQSAGVGGVSSASTNVSLEGGGCNCRVRNGPTSYGTGLALLAALAVIARRRTRQHDGTTNYRSNTNPRCSG